MDNAVVALVGWGVTLALAGQSVARWVSLRQLSSLPRCMAGRLKAGRFLIAGKALLPEGVRHESPLGAVPCVWVRFRVGKRTSGLEVRNGSFHKSSGYATAERGESSSPFWLQDESGRVEVDPSKASVESPATKSWYPGEGSWTWGSDLVGKRPAATRVTEELVPAGAQILVVAQIPASNAEEDGQIRRRLAALKANQPELLARFDADGDGAIDPQEWDRARAEVRAEVARDGGAAPRLSALGKDAPVRIWVGTRDEVLAGLRNAGLGWGALALLAGVAAWFASLQ